MRHTSGSYRSIEPCFCEHPGVYGRTVDGGADVDQALVRTDKRASSPTTSHGLRPRRWRTRMQLWGDKGRRAMCVLAVLALLGTLLAGCMEDRQPSLEAGPDDSAVRGNGPSTPGIPSEGDGAQKRGKLNDMRRRFAADGNVSRREAIRLAIGLRERVKDVEATRRRDTWSIVVVQVLGCEMYYEFDATTGEGGSIAAGCS